MGMSAGIIIGPIVKLSGPKTNKRLFDVSWDDLKDRMWNPTVPNMECLLPNVEWGETHLSFDKQSVECVHEIMNVEAKLLKFTAFFEPELDKLRELYEDVDIFYGAVCAYT